MKSCIKFGAAVLLLSALGTHAVAADLSLLNVFPNPVRTYEGQTEIVFDNVPGAKVRIFNAQGTLVREAQLDDSTTSFHWDLRNDSGADVASGVYIYFVDSSGSTANGKVAVIR